MFFFGIHCWRSVLGSVRILCLNRAVCVLVEMYMTLLIMFTWKHPNKSQNITRRNAENLRLRSWTVHCTVVTVCKQWHFFNFYIFVLYSSPSLSPMIRHWLVPLVLSGIFYFSKCPRFANPRPDIHHSSKRKGDVNPGVVVCITGGQTICLCD